jgi:hypothetical protein
VEERRPDHPRVVPVDERGERLLVARPHGLEEGIVGDLGARAAPFDDRRAHVVRRSV